ncbi:hypothetical protein [Peptostreptococcus porci]|nr:hypothetical protein [Peptostreptococcus porci]MDY6232195.1 hypothetical protein [Peptostreptococcus porci]DAN96310.1 MAG TPA: toxin [Caudoviricetes sp.]
MIICELVADIVIGVITTYIVNFIDNKHKNNRHEYAAISVLLN